MNSSEICTGFSGLGAVFLFQLYRSLWPKLELNSEHNKIFLSLFLHSLIWRRPFYRDSFHPQASVWIEEGSVECDGAAPALCETSRIKHERVAAVSSDDQSQQFIQISWSPSAGLWARFSEKTAVFEVLFDDDVGYGVEHELDVLRVGGAGHVRVDFLDVSAQVQVQELNFDVITSILVGIGAWAGQQ